MSATFNRFTWLLGLLALAASANATRYFVKVDGTGTGLDNWSNACALQYALSQASGATSDEIWVAKGTTSIPTYKPTTGTDRSISFSIPTGVKVYGGFIGDEEHLVDRNPEANETILDGNIDTSGSNDSFHVVRLDSANGSTKLSGFTIKNGNANGSGNNAVGGGIFATGDTLRANRLRVINNFAHDGGAGLFLGTGGGSQVANAWFQSNEVTNGDGGAVLVANGRKQAFVNCVYYQNTCSAHGGAIAADAGGDRNISVEITNCTLSANTAGTSGGATWDGASNNADDFVIVLDNCIVWGNTGSPQIASADSNVTADTFVDHSDVQDGSWAGSHANIQADPLFRATNNAYRFTLPHCSPCVDTGEDDLLTGDETDVNDDTDGGEIIPWDIRKGIRVWNNNPDESQNVEMGAYENCPGDVDGNSIIDLNDLTRLLSCFGSAATGECAWANLAQGTGVRCNSTIGLEDLTELLSHFGQSCLPGGIPPGSPATASVTTTVTAYDTGGYSGDGFYGENAHFVFDIKVTISISDDDWTGSGCLVTAASKAAFRLVADAGNPPAPGTDLPKKYSTFFSVPYAVDANNRFNYPFPSGGIVGRYSGSGGFVYETGTLNAAWYDTNASSNDGPAAVMRLVIDVSGVPGANTSGGFGSVYFTTGTPGSGDIKVADMTFDVKHKYGDTSSNVTTGSFYVTD